MSTNLVAIGRKLVGHVEKKLKIMHDTPLMHKKSLKFNMIKKKPPKNSEGRRLTMKKLAFGANLGNLKTRIYGGTRTAHQNGAVQFLYIQANYFHH